MNFYRAKELIAAVLMAGVVFLGYGDAQAATYIYTIHSVSGQIDPTADFRTATVNGGRGTLAVNDDLHTAIVSLDGVSGTFTNLGGQQIPLWNLELDIFFGPTSRPGHEQINNQTIISGNQQTIVPRGFADQIAASGGHWTDLYRPLVNFNFFNAQLAVNPEQLIGYVSVGLTRTPGHADGRNTFFQFHIDPIVTIIPSEPTPPGPVIPEPATALLFGAGLVGAKMRSRAARSERSA